MSQQSVTNLSQAATTLYKPPKKVGGISQFHKGVAGKHATLLTVTDSHIDALRDTQEEKKAAMLRAQPLGAKEFHYQTMEKKRADRSSYGCDDLPPKPLGSIPGYSGCVPRREALNVHGGTHRADSVMAVSIFAAEQERNRTMASNILPPAKDLKTPDTLRLQ
ncbi:unnamed protein product [Amoebophrya sp. A25]|nr:unnamed protein product [Amoebophrya sp. A25]|eukprot:GSA25T00003055001.1